MVKIHGILKGFTWKKTCNLKNVHNIFASNHTQFFCNVHFLLIIIDQLTWFQSVNKYFSDVTSLLFSKKSWQNSFFLKIRGKLRNSTCRKKKLGKNLQYCEKHGKTI